MKNIVVATDLSVTARNAYRYARALSKTLGVGLSIVHVKENVMNITDVVRTPFPSNNDLELIKDIEELVTEENQAMGINASEHEVKIRILSGDPVDVLASLSKTEATDLIVIGTTGLSDVLTKIFGSVSSKVSNKAHCPVILVPRNARWKNIEQILYASDHDSMKAEFAQDIMDFAVKMNAGIHFVNVRNYDPVGEIKQKDIDWGELFVTSNSNLPYETSTIYGNDTVKELNEYCEGKSIDLMVFASKHRNFWENLMHKSITENMALSTDTPIMVVHKDDKK